MPSFRFSDFEIIADDLATQGGEGKLRVAVSRLYYALFHLAKQRTGVRARDHIHAAVVAEVRRRDRGAGDKLDALKRYRLDADYNLNPSLKKACGNWDLNWKTVRMIAKQIAPRLNRL